MQSLVLWWLFVEDLLQLVLERGLRVLFYDFVEVAEETVEAVAFLDGDDEVVHHLPVVLHLLAQVPLQPSHEAFANLQLELHLVRVHSVLLHSFVGLHAGLPLFLAVVGLVGLEVQVHLRCCLALLLQDPQPLLIGQVVLEVFPPALRGVRVQPLQEDDVVLELALTDLLETKGLRNLELLERLLNQPNVAIVILRIPGAEIEFEDVD